jgi:hypothetical protein
LLITGQVVLQAFALLRQALQGIRLDRRSEVTPAVEAVVRRLSVLLTKEGAEAAKQTPELLQTVAAIAKAPTIGESVGLAALSPVLLQLGKRQKLHARIVADLLGAMLALVSVALLPLSAQITHLAAGNRSALA